MASYGIDRTGAAGGSGTASLIGALAELADPDVNSIIYWDDTAGGFAWATVTDVSHLTDIAGLTATDGNIIVGDGTNWVAESGATARTSLGLGTGDGPTFSAATFTAVTAMTLSGAAATATITSGGRYVVTNIADYHAGGLRLSDSTTGNLWQLGPNSAGDLYLSFYNGSWNDTYKFSSSTGLFLIAKSYSGNPVISQVQNDSNTTNSHAKLLLYQGGGTSGGDPYVQFAINGGQNFALGIDNSDSDAFILDNSTVIGGGTAILRATSNGLEHLRFNATQNASASANTLDDYEEGTWTPAVGGTATYTTQAATYVKVGQLCHVDCRMVIDTLGTGSSSAISGFPFTCGTLANKINTLPMSYWATLSSAVIYITAFLGSGAASCGFTWTLVANASATISVAPFQSGADVAFAGTYRTSS